MENLLRKKHNFKWDNLAIKAFEEVKKAIAKVPTLFHLDFKKEFIMYCYALEYTMLGILLQRNEKDDEVPIYFMSVPLKKHKLCYSLVKKQAFIVVKFVKHF